MRTTKWSVKWLWLVLVWIIKMMVPKVLHLQLTYSENSQGFHPFWALDPTGDHLLPLGDWLAIFIA